MNPGSDKGPGAQTAPNLHSGEMYECWHFIGLTIIICLSAFTVRIDYICRELTVSILVSCSAMSSAGNPSKFVGSNSEASAGGLLTPL